MPTEETSEEHIDSQKLTAFLETLVNEYTVSSNAAWQIASSLVAADLRGHSSHGSIRLEKYLEMIGDGRIDPVAEPRIERDQGSSANIDGRRAFGQITGRKAVEVVGSKAREYGVGVVGVKNANHLGRIGEWTERVTNQNLLFAAFVKGDGELVAPPGSANRKLSTNPISFGVPTFDVLNFPILLDMATSQVAHGKIRERSKQEIPLPEGWTTTATSDPVTNATEFVQGAGALLPLGGVVSGYKGFGLSVMSELFASILGNDIIPEDRTGGMNNTAAFIAIDPTRFSSCEVIETNIRTLVEHLRDADSPSDISPGVAADGDTHLLPGEMEYQLAQERRENGIPIPNEVAATLSEIAAKNGHTDAVPTTLE